jgi:hypothetical protein
VPDTTHSLPAQAPLGCLRHLAEWRLSLSASALLHDALAAPSQAMRCARADSTVAADQPRRARMSGRNIVTMPSSGRNEQMR